MTSCVSRIATGAAAVEGSGLRALVTGAAGFAGSHPSVMRGVRGHAVAAPGRDGEVAWTVAVRDADGLRRAFREVRPRAVFPLAAVAFVPGAEDAPALCDSVNREGTVRVLDAAAEVGARTLFVSSGTVYGRLTGGQAASRETDPLRPEGAYACSKAAAEAECRARDSRQEIVIARAFNHTGPGQSPDYVCSDFARQIALIERGLQPALVEVGELSAERDFSDVRDVVQAYLRLWEEGEPGQVYNVCSGRAVAIRWVLDTLVEACSRPVDVRVASARLREGEVNRTVGSYAKIEAALGWRPTMDLRRSLEDLRGYWRENDG